MSKVLVISTSLHAFSNSESLADEFIRGAKEAGHEVEKVSLKDKQIAFCQGCLACQKIGRCVIPDDAQQITEKALEADVICFATPIYYYEMSGQMKTLLDRMNPLYNLGYHFHDIYMLTSAAENEEYVPKRAISGLQGWIDCFNGARLAGEIFAGGVTNGGEIKSHPALDKAYKLGLTVK